MKLDFILDGERLEIECEPTRRLLDILREDCGRSAIKEGCGEGECGACAVLVDGRLGNACLLAAGQISGADIVTMKSFRDTERFAVLQDAFGEAGGVQCGFCTPGMIMACEALLRDHPQPDEATVRDALSGNLCRCTGYNMIVAAVGIASRKGAGLW